MIDLHEALLPELRRITTNVPDYVLKEAITEASRRFFTESEMWTEKQKLDAFGKRVIVFPVTTHTHIVDVAEAETEHGYLLHCGFDGVHVLFLESPDCEVTFTFVLRPEVATVPDWLLVHGRDAIIQASAYSLKAQTSQPWTNASEAAYHMQQYNYFLGNARLAFRPQVVRFHPFA